MKNTLTIILLFVFGLTFAQAPLRINYQGVIRGSDLAPVLNQTVGIQFQILQGSSSGTVVHTEPQTISTNSLGLITTQIGLNGNLSTINWQNGPFFLKVSVDFFGGTNYDVLGTQEMLSVPFSMHAKTVPATYSNNVLDVGGNTFTLALTPNTTITAQGIANVTSTLTNEFLVSVPEPTFTSVGATSITGTYPNLTITSPTVAPDATITPSGIITITNTAQNLFTVGVQQPIFTSVGASSITGNHPNYTITSPTVAPNTTLSPSGIVSVTNTGQNAFIVGVQNPTFTPIGASSITGVYPNLTLTSPSVAPNTTLSPSGIVSVTNTGQNAYVVGVPSPSYTSVGASSITGVYPNLTLTSPSVAPNTSIVPSGIVSLTNTGQNAYMIGVNAPTFVSVGITTISGLYPNLTVNTPSTNISGSGAAQVTSLAVNQFTIGVPQTTITVSNLPGTTSVSTAGTNSFNINVPPGVTPVTPSVVGTGAAAVTPTTGNFFTVNVPPANVVLTQTVGATTVSSPGTNSFNINVAPGITPTITPFGVLTRTAAGSSFSLTVPGTSITSTGASTITSSGTNTFNVHVPPTSVLVTSTAGAVGVSSAGTNTFNINVPPAITPTLTASGVATRTQVGSSFTLDVPAPTFTPATGILGIGTGTVIITPTISLSGNILSVGPSTNNVTLPTTPSVFAAGVATVSAAPNYTVGVPATNLAVTQATGAISMTTVSPNNFSLNIPPNITPTITGTGLAITTSTANAFTVNVPVLTFTPTTGGLGSGTNSVNITQPITISGTTLTVGAPSNSINISAISPWRQAVSSVTLANATDRVGVGASAPTENLQVESTGASTVSILSGAGLVSELSFGTTANHTGGRFRYDNNLDQFSLWTNSVADRLFIDFNGNVALGQNFTVAKLDVNGNARLNTGKLFLGAVGGVNSGYQGIYEDAGALRFAVFRLAGAPTTFAPAGNSYDAMTIKASSGEVGIGTINPLENLQVESATNSTISIVSGASNVAELIFGSSANHALGRNRYDNLSNTMSFWTNSSSRMTLNSTGQVVIGGGAPLTANTGLVVSRSGAFDNRLVITGGDNSNTYGGILNFTENQSQSAGMTIRLDAVANKMLFTTDNAGASPIVAIGGYSGATPGMNIGANFTSANPPSNGLIVEGNVGVGTNAPARKFEVSPGLGGISDNQGQSTFYHAWSTGNAIYAESNNTGVAGGSPVFTRAMLAGYNGNNPFGGILGNSGVWGIVTGSGNSGYGVIGSFGPTAAPVTYAGLGGALYSGVFMGGNVGVGTVAPAHPLHVVGSNPLYTGYFENTSNASGVAGLYAQANVAGGGNRYGVYAVASNATNFSEGVFGMAINGSQGFGVWGTSSGASSYNIGVFGTTTGGPGTQYGLYCNGSGGYTGTWTLISDQRFKTNVKPLDGGLDKIMRLQPKTYNLKTAEYEFMNFPSGTQLGLIAQEVAEVIPELVEDGINPGPVNKTTGESIGSPLTFKTMNYIGLTPVLVKAIQEQQVIIENQQKKLEELEARLKALENK